MLDMKHINKITNSKFAGQFCAIQQKKNHLHYRKQAYAMIRNSLNAERYVAQNSQFLFPTM